MSRSRLVQFLRAKSPWVTLLTVAPLVAVILGLTACVKHPVGDPEKSKVDPKLSGVWWQKETDSATLLFLRPYDARTYYVKSLSYGEQGGEIRPQSQLDGKAWLTTIGGAAFLTLQPLPCAQIAGLKSEEPPYFVMKTEVVAGTLRLRIVNGGKDPASSASSSRELEAVIAKHLEAESLYAGPASVFKKADDKALITSVLKAFHLEDGNG